MNSVSNAAASPKTGGKALDEDVVGGDAGVKLFAQDFEEAVELFRVFGVVGCVNDDLGKRGPRLKALPAMRALPWGRLGPVGFRGCIGWRPVVDRRRFWALLLFHSDAVSRSNSLRGGRFGGGGGAISED
jgi:hypothetical protein